MTSSQILVSLEEKRREKDRKESDVKMEVEARVMHLQCKEPQHCQQPQEAEREAKNGFSPRTPEGINPADTLTLDFRPFGTLRE